MLSSFLVFGERGIGKTALAKLIRSVATSNDEELYALNILTSYYSAEKGQGINSVLQESINKLTDQLDSNTVQNIGNRLGKLFRDGKFEIGAFGFSAAVDLSQSEQSREITIKDQTVAILSSIIKNIQSSNTHDGILIIIDEIHNLADIKGSASILRNIITSLDVENLGRLSFLLIGYEEDIKTFFAEDPSSRRVFDVIELDTMPPEDATEILKKGLEAIELPFDRELLSEKVKVAGGYPHSIQLLGHNLVEVDKDNNIDKTDWAEAIHLTAQELRNKDFSNMYSFGKKQTERDKLLAYLAEQDKPVTRKEISGTGITKNPPRVLKELISSGAIKTNEEDNTISLQSQLFRTAILFDIVSRDFKDEN